MTLDDTRGGGAGDGDGGWDSEADWVEFDDAAAKLAEAPDPASFRLESVSVAPRKGDLDVTRLALAWVAV